MKKAAICASTVMLFTILIAGSGCASSSSSKTVQMSYFPPQPLSSSLLYDRYPGYYRADDMIRGDWPVTDSAYQGSETITYRVRTYDYSGGRRWSSDHVNRRAVSTREFQAVR